MTSASEDSSAEKVTRKCVQGSQHSKVNREMTGSGVCSSLSAAAKGNISSSLDSWFEIIIVTSFLPFPPLLEMRTERVGQEDGERDTEQEEKSFLLSDSSSFSLSLSSKVEAAKHVMNWDDFFHFFLLFPVTSARETCYMFPSLSASSVGISFGR